MNWFDITEEIINLSLFFLTFLNLLVENILHKNPFTIKIPPILNKIKATVSIGIYLVNPPIRLKIRPITTIVIPTK